MKRRTTFKNKNECPVKCDLGRAHTHSRKLLVSCINQSLEAAGDAMLLKTKNGQTYVNHESDCFEVQ